MREGGVAGVADQGDGLVDPGWERVVDAQLPLANLALRDVVEHALDHGAEIGEDLLHDTLVTASGVSGVGGSCEVAVRLDGGQVVDGVVGDGVGDDMALFADPAGYARVVYQGQELGVVLDLVLVDHDPVGGLVGVLDADIEVEKLQHRSPSLTLDTVGT